MLYSLLPISFYFKFFTYEKALLAAMLSFSSTFLLSLLIQKISIAPTRDATGQNDCLDVHMMYLLQWSFPTQGLYAACAFSVQPPGGTYHSPAQTQPEFCKRSAEKTEKTILVS